MIETKTTASIMSKEVFTSPSDQMVLAVVTAMIEKNAEAAILLDPQTQQVAGIFTERDLSRRVVGKGLDPAKTPIAQVMTKNPICLSPNDEIRKLIELMLDGKFRHIPIKEGNNLVGIVSVLHLLRYLGFIYQTTMFSSAFI